MKKAHIFHGHQKVSFEIPSRWRILTSAQFDEYSSKKEVKELTKNALKNPVHAKTLKHALSPSDKVAIIVEDLTRASPKRLILETLREELDVVPIPPPKYFRDYGSRNTSGPDSRGVGVHIRYKFKIILVSKGIPRETGKKWAFYMQMTWSTPLT